MQNSVSAFWSSYVFAQESSDVENPKKCNSSATKYGNEKGFNLASKISMFKIRMCKSKQQFICAIQCLSFEYQFTGFCPVLGTNMCKNPIKNVGGGEQNCWIAELYQSCCSSSGGPGDSGGPTSTTTTGSGVGDKHRWMHRLHNTLPFQEHCQKRVSFSRQT